MKSDAELVASVVSGDVEAFGRLSERYEKTLLAVALTETRDFHVAEDVVQESLLLAFRRLGTLREHDKFGPWLFQIARRQTVEVARRRRAAVSVPLDNAEVEHGNDSVVRSWIDSEFLLEIVGQLPDHERVLIGLRYFDGHSMAEIASITGRPIGTVTKQISRAAARLRDWWDKENK